MKNNQNNWQSPDQNNENENHRVGRELYNRDQQRSGSTGQPGQHTNHWDNGNNFHVGYSNQSRSHFPEDTHQRTTNADWGGSRDKHYGTREYSTYRNPNSLDYGDGRGHRSSPTQFDRNSAAGRNQLDNRHHYDRNSSPSGNQQHSSQFSQYGDGRGNYNARQDSYGHGGSHDHIHGENRLDQRRRLDDSNENYYRGGYMDSRGVRNELPNPDVNPYNDYPGGRSRYKDDDYRYGSGNHTWYEERRYTDNNGHRRDTDKGDVLGDIGAGAREAWNDLTGGARNLWNRATGNRHDHEHGHDHRGGNQRNQEYRSSRDRGYERGPRWSDETDSGDDSFFYSGNRNPRYY
ncbi:MAG: hypothetical protein ACO1OQ_11895 [Rufibacter sp.]